MTGPKPFSLEWSIQYFEAAAKQGLRTPAHRCGSMLLADRARLLAVLTKASEIIERADARCLAADGPVGHVREEMTDAEWRELYLLVVKEGVRP